MSPSSPLTDRDYQRLSDTLQRFQSAGCMNLEQLDGFFTALQAGPDIIRPEECLPLILGEAFDDERAFPSGKALEHFVGLLLGHWQDIARSLARQEGFQPWLEENDLGEVKGNDWAEGFAEAMQLMQDDWNLLFDDEDNASLLEPIMLLAFERHPDPDMRPRFDNGQLEERDQLLAAISPSVHGIHAYFSRLRAAMEAELAAEEADQTRPD